MGWGGARVGAGKKPRPKAKFGIVSGGRVDAPVDAVVDSRPQPLAEPPVDMTPEQQGFWKACAPLAIERRTLIDATVPAFRMLCELHAKKVLVGSMVDKGALGGLRVYLQLSKQVESLMARFCLAPFGKPATKTEAPKAAANPWKALG